MTIQDWLRHAVEDARARNLPALVPLLEGLAKSTMALREADAAARLADQRSSREHGTTTP
jgi:hypothetical protein